MGKSGPKQIPVTARVQKGTKGGIVQPSISGMGSIAKIKVSSPAKLVGRSKSGYKGITKKESQGSEALKNQKKCSRIQQEVAHMESAISNYQKKGGKDKSVERKTERAAKVRRKGVQALESGNLAKSRRLRRREARINKRIEKKKSGQASKAIEPK